MSLAQVRHVAGSQFRDREVLDINHRLDKVLEVGAALEDTQQKFKGAMGLVPPPTSKHGRIRGGAAG